MGGTTVGYDEATRRLLEERYGHGRRWSRLTAWILGASVSVAFLGWLAWATWDHAQPTISSEFIGFSVIDEHQAEARFDVRRKDAAVSGTCIVRALAEDHSLVGEVVVPVEAGPKLKARMTRPIRTERRATAVELVGCTAPGQNRPR